MICLEETENGEGWGGRVNYTLPTLLLDRGMARHLFADDVFGRPDGSDPDG